MDVSELIDSKIQFPFVDSSGIRELSLVFRKRSYTMSSFFLNEGDLAAKVGFLKSGFMRTVTLNSDGAEATIRIIRPTEFIIGGFSPNSPSPTSIQALTPCEVFETDWIHLKTIIKRNKSIGQMFNTFLMTGSFLIIKNLSDLIRLDGTQRYLRFLNDFPGLVDLIPHYYIANYLGISTVQLSRIRSKYKRINICK